MFLLDRLISGNQFQVDSGHLGVKNAADPKVKDYAKEMIPSHEQVEQKLTDILKRKGVTQPPTSLLESSYTAMLSTLNNEKGASFDREYVRQQINYQTGNDALYRWELANGSDPDLKAFAKEVLVKIDEHFDLAKTLDRQQMNTH
jgi:putative membrane protein